MLNPYFIYVVTFLASLLVYQLGWSVLFPQLKPNLILFLMGTMGAALLLGAYFQSKRYISFTKIPWNSKIPATVLFITILWIVEFIYNGGIPLLLIIRGADYDYIKFGIPTLHVFVVTFTSFVAVYLFHQVVVHRDRQALLFYLICMSFSVLLLNRGMLMIDVVSSMIVYLQSVKRLSSFKLASAGAILLIVLFGFGYLGNVRSSRGKSGEPSDKYILDLVQASDSFRDGFVPSEYIWTYIYLSSPIGNLQYNIDHGTTQEFSIRNSVSFLNSEFVFDFISKRVNDAMSTSRINALQFIDSINVATVYANPYLYAGWPGMILMAIMILMFPVFYLGLIRKKNVFYVTATSILGSLYVFLVFDNMFTFTGLSFQLVYPLLLGRFFSPVNSRDGAEVENLNNSPTVYEA